MRRQVPYTKEELHGLSRPDLIVVATQFGIQPNGLQPAALINTILLRQAEASAAKAVLPVDSRLLLLENTVRALEANIVEMGAAVHQLEQTMANIAGRLGYSYEAKTNMYKYRSRFVRRTSGE